MSHIFFAGQRGGVGPAWARDCLRPGAQRRRLGADQDVGDGLARAQAGRASVRGAGLERPWRPFSNQRGRWGPSAVLPHWGVWFCGGKGPSSGGGGKAASGSGGGG